MKHFDILEIFNTGSTIAPQFKIGTSNSNFLGLSIDDSGNFHIESSSGAIPNISIGKQTTILGSGAIAIGNSAYSNSSIAIGDNSKASGQGSVSIGTNTSGMSFDTVAIGRGVQASGNGSMILGHCDTTIITNSQDNSLALSWNDDVISYLLAKDADSYLYTTGRFAIGHKTPSTKLHVSGTTRIQGVRDDSAGDTLQLYSSGGTVNAVFEDGGNVGIGTDTPSSVAILEIKSTSKGLRLTPMTANQASAIPPIEGLIVCVSDVNSTFTSIGFWGYENGAWEKF